MTLRQMRVTVDGKVYAVTVEVLDEGASSSSPDHRPPSSPAPTPTPKPTPAAVTPATSPAPAPRRAAAGSGAPGAIVAPLAGTVVEVHVSVGQSVKVGDRVITLEAMKMDTAVAATAAGVVKEIRVSKGATVAEGALLLVLG